MRSLAPLPRDFRRALARPVTEPAQAARPEQMALPVEILHGRFCQTREEADLSTVKSTFFGLAWALLGKGRMSARFDGERNKIQTLREKAQEFSPGHLEDRMKRRNIPACQDQPH